MRKKNGFMTPAICLVVLLSTLLFLAVYYTNVTANNIRIKSREPALTVTINRRTALERSESVFHEDYEFSGPIDYSDLGITIHVEEIMRDAQSRTVRLVVKETKDGMATTLMAYHALVWQGQSPVLEIIATETE